MYNRGVLFYHLGRSCAVRLAVAMHSLRKHYTGPASVIHVGDEGADDCYDIAMRHRVGFIKTPSRVSPGRNTALLGKCQLHLDTPYSISVFLDADTVTIRPFPELFKAAEDHHFAATAFADWKSYGGHYRRRIKQWAAHVPPAWIKAAVDLGPAINTGVFSFMRFGQLQHLIYEYAERARELFIPDEIGVCILAPQCRHIVMPQEYNCSCRYSDPTADNVRIVHFHGDKHARIKDGEPQNHADIWYREFEEVRDRPEVKRNIEHDRQLRKHLPEWDKIKGAILGR